MERTDYDLLSIDQVAHTIGQSVRNLRRLIETGEFPDGFPAPTTKRWMWSTVRDWILMKKMAAIGAQKADIPGHSGTNGLEDEKGSSQPKKPR